MLAQRSTSSASSLMWPRQAAQAIMQHIFWLVPGSLAGRPGPNRQPWNLAELRAAGFQAVLSLNDGELCHADEFDSNGIDYKCVSLSDSAPPRPGDLERCLVALPKAYSYVQQHISAGRKVLIHCSSGKDRTGLLLAYYLMRTEGARVKESINRVKLVRPIAFSAYGWEEFSVQVLSASDA